MTETSPQATTVAEAQKLAQLAAAETLEQPVSPIDHVEDMLELAETAQETRHVLARRWQEVHPKPEGLSEEQKQRVVSHAAFLTELGKVTVGDWEAIGVPSDAELDDEHLAKVTLHLDSVEPGYTASLTRPDWHDHFPEHTKLTKEDAPEGVDLSSLDEAERMDLQLKKWQEFKDQFPEDMQVLLEDLRTTNAKLEAAHEDPSLLAAFEEQKGMRYDVIMAASATRSLHRTANHLRDRANQLRLSLPDGATNKAVLAQADELERQADVFDLQSGQYAQGESVQHELARRSRLDDRRNLRHGLLYTPEMSEVVDGFVPQLLGGKPVLLVGETGGAKTAAAEEMARKINRQTGKEPDAYEFVSGYGQMNSYQLMGKDTLKEGSVEFAYGAITRAMIEGVPLIVDEVNAMDPDIAKRLNKVLQLRPGDTFQIQEDGGERIPVKKGFCVIATANEKSTRYKGVNEMSADFKARFGANTARVNYPDMAILPGQVPTTLLRLAEATLVDQYGNLPEDNPAIDQEQVVQFVAACHKLQRFFSLPGTELSESEVFDPADRTRTSNGETILKSETISPRLMTGILEDIRIGGRSGVTIQNILKRYVDGVTDQSDRRIIERTLRGHELIS